ncbi:MAG: phage terminase small subunit P27 family [Gammaproteobacteria bacterium]|nr:phage terminase small subunit P27 family [Gammaproteobacteria bacterium]
MKHEPKVERVDRLEPPIRLDRYAKAVWERAAPILDEVGYLTKIDLGLLAQYCVAFGLWLKTYKEWIREGRPALYKNPNGTMHEHPLIKVWRDAQKDAVSLGNQLGISPTARSKLGFEFSETIKNQRKYGTGDEKAPTEKEKPKPPPAVEETPESRFFPSGNA